jgi:dTDP-4-dehydrorhamnose reductase
MTKILLTGANGQLGFELTRSLAPLGEVIAVTRAECDLGNRAALAKLVRAVAPDIIVNPAAYTAVDKAESESDVAFAVNATAPQVLAEEAAQLGAFIVHYVFDGRKAAPYVETDPTNPESVYGRSKYAGELNIATATATHLILRTSWVLGAHGSNFAKTMLRLANDRDQLNVVADQFGAPTSAALLADITGYLVRQYLREGREGFPFGKYHVAAAGETNWCDYARFVLASAQAAGKTLKATADTVHAISSSEFPTPARRPSNSRLDTALFTKTFGLRLPPWEEGVRQTLTQILLPR